MRTLTRWMRFLSGSPIIIHCPRMRVRSFHDEDLGWEGPGHLTFKGRDDFRFEFHSQNADFSEVTRRLTAAEENPYDSHQQLKLFATDYDDREWVCGWTLPRLTHIGALGRLVTGRLTNVSTLVSGPFVPKTSSVELLLAPPPKMPFTEHLVTSVSAGEKELLKSVTPGRHTCEVLGTTVLFSRDPEQEALWITADTSPSLSHPYAENWLSEPLRILCGQLLYPRLVARNRGDGSAFVEVRRSPESPFGLGGLATSFKDQSTAQRDFWDFYRDYLTYIALDKTDDGNPNFETHSVTRLHEEIVQASEWSQWLISLAAASAAESLIKRLAEPVDMVSDLPCTEIESLDKHVREWRGAPDIRSRILSAVSRLGTRTPSSLLQVFVKRGLVDADQADAWDAIRNRIMHGNLSDPWPTEMSDGSFRSLIMLIHALTKALVKGRSESNKGAP